VPEALLIFDDQARLIGLENAVADSEGPGTIPQRFAFEGRMPGPIAWPRRLTIAQRGSPYFELTLATFSAGPV
jgi:hypothetical protein